MKFKFSYQMLFLMLGVHLGAIICVLLSTINFEWKLLIFTLVVGYFIIIARQYIWKKSHNSICGLRKNSDGLWQINNNQNLFINIKFKTKIITRFFIILTFKCENIRKKNVKKVKEIHGSIFLFSDSGTQKELRHLRILLNS
jgi:hypothetical protein